MPSPSSVSLPRCLLAFAVLCHLVLATAYAVWLPAFEGPDENDHFQYASHLAGTGSLPLVRGTAAALGRPIGDESSMGHHPPLYYAILASTMRAFGSGDWVPAWRDNAERLDHRPDLFATGDGWIETEPRAAMHWAHGFDEVAPVSPGIVVLRWLRAWSVLFGLGSLLLTWMLARRLFSERPQVAAVAVVGLSCVPQWSFVHGALDNGNLAAPLALAVIVLLVGFVQRQRMRVLEGVVVGLLAGAAVATKLTALFLVPLIGAVVLVLLWRSRGARGGVVAAAAAAAAAFALPTVPILWRNLTLYGEPLALAVHRKAFETNVVPAGHRVEWLLGAFPWRTFRSAIGELGWGVLPVPSAVLAVAGAALALGVLGWIVHGRELARRGVVALLVPVVAIALSVAGFVRFNVTFFQPQGRYLLPVYGAVAVLVAAGLVALGERLPAAPRRWMVVLALLPPALAAWVFVGRFLPAFGDPTVSDPYYASVIEGLRTPAPPARATIVALQPDDDASMVEPPTFRWRDPTARPGDRYSLHLYGRDGELIMATYEWAGVSFDAPWTLPASAWNAIPANEPVQWKLRRLPDRRAGESAADVPETVPRTVTRLPGR